MKSIKIILFATVCLLAISACGNSTSTSGTATSTSEAGGGSGKLKSETVVVTSGGKTDSNITTFAYDSQNRVIKQISVPTIGGTVSGSDTITYSYFADSIIQNMSGLWFNSITYYLNSNGYRTSDNSGNTWTYNSNGFLISSSSVVSGSHTFNTSYTYNSSNQLATKTKTEILFGVTTTIGTDTYSYTDNAINSPAADDSWQTGKSEGALCSTDVNVKAGVTTTVTNTYVTDSQNRLSKATTVSSAAGSSPLVIYYAYY